MILKLNPSGGSASGSIADRGLAMPGPTSNVSRTKVGRSNASSGANTGLKHSCPFSIHLEGQPPL